MSLVQQLQGQASEDIELWVAFGTGTHLRYLAAHEIVEALYTNVARALPAFHAFTGCDTVSCFFGKGKKTTLDTWNSYPEVTPVFLAMSMFSEICDEWMTALEDGWINFI